MDNKVSLLQHSLPFRTTVLIGWLNQSALKYMRNEAVYKFIIFCFKQVHKRDDEIWSSITSNSSHCYEFIYSSHNAGERSWFYCITMHESKLVTSSQWLCHYCNIANGNAYMFHWFMHYAYTCMCIYILHLGCTYCCSKWSKY